MAKETFTAGSMLGALAAVVVGASLLVVPEAALAQGGTGAQSPSMGSSQSGSAIDSPKGADVSRPRSSPEDKRQFDAPFTGQPPGLGEKGSGQSQSTMERSGGQQRGTSPSELQEGKTAQAMEELQQQRDNRGAGDQGSSSY
jgi:hypothetical protein